MVGNTAVEAIENGEVEVHPMIQIRKAIDKIEQEHIKQSGKTFRQYAEEQLKGMGLKPKPSAASEEGPVH